MRVATPFPALGLPWVRRGGHRLVQLLVVHLGDLAESAVRKYRVRPAASTRILPYFFTAATSTSAPCGLARCLCVEAPATAGAAVAAASVREAAAMAQAARIRRDEAWAISQLLSVGARTCGPMRCAVHGRPASAAAGVAPSADAQLAPVDPGGSHLEERRGQRAGRARGGPGRAAAHRGRRRAPCPRPGRTARSASRRRR